MLAAICWKLVALNTLACGLPDVDLTRVRAELKVAEAYYTGWPPTISKPFLVRDTDIDWPAVLQLARNYQPR